MKISGAKRFVLPVLLALLLFLAARDYLGYHYYYGFQEEIGRAKSIESSFLRLESLLEKAVRFSGNPLFRKELGRLYFERALGENQFGSPERRDHFLDLSRESLVRAANGNPLDAFALYDLGRVYLLYNYPLLTYLDKAKAYFRRALELNPADEFLNVNIVFIYLTQWEFLSGEEKDYVLGRISEAKAACPDFVPKLRKRCREELGDEAKLEAVLDAAGEAAAGRRPHPGLSSAPFTPASLFRGPGSAGGPGLEEPGGADVALWK